MATDNTQAELYYIIRYGQRPGRIQTWSNGMVEFTYTFGAHVLKRYAFPDTMKLVMEEYYDKNSHSDGLRTSEAVQRRS